MIVQFALGSAVTLAGDRSRNNLSQGTWLFSWRLNCITLFCFALATVHDQHVSIAPGLTFRFKPFTILWVVSFPGWPNCSCASLMLHGFLCVMEVHASSLVMQLKYKQYTNWVSVLMMMSKTKLRPFLTIMMPLVSPVIFHPSSIDVDRLHRLYLIWGEYATLFKISANANTIFINQLETNQIKFRNLMKVYLKGKIK